ncbi:MAG: hypothetical protein EOP11_06350 [Proteobacteria bacterium]|nr:MAG: hypothetical protein EOP11_06350 [Pseudomonadota bacterium]
MAPLKILGIYRDPIFSNNAIEVDRLILEHSIAQLEKLCPLPLQIEFVEEAQAKEIRGSFDLVLTMAQREETLSALEKNLSASPVWNSSAAIRNCYRLNMSAALIAMPVGYVPYHVLATDAEALPELQKNQGYWVKRSDFHAISNEDVSLAKTPAEILEKLAAFRARGVVQVILQPHIEGDIYKFYGVRGKFFRAIRVKNVLGETVKADLAELQRVAALSADALELMVYGGDAILDTEGRFHLIDLNDWPSFRICREEAARAIAELALDHFKLSPPFTRETARAPARAAATAQR